MKRQARGWSIYLGILALILVLAWIWQTGVTNQQEMTYSKYQAYVAQGLADYAEIEQNKEANTGTVYIYQVSGQESQLIGFAYVPDVIAEGEFLNTYNVTVHYTDVQRDSVFVTAVLPALIVVVGCFFIFMLTNGRAAGSNNMGNFGKSRAHMSGPNDKRVTFQDVAGLQEEKEELAEVVDFLKEPGRYTQLGARIPKGIILVGPPGTGKTLLARAIAGEAGVPFFSISGSDFVEMFVGVGASRVRDLFADAKKHAPCIIFIDEIDAVARRRGSGMGGGHDEREQTLNQLLVEMDGFGVNEGIIVMAATNRVDILDPAILRPGRFDRKVGVGKPDVRGREEILRVHVQKKPLGDDVDLKKIAQTTAGFSGADLENLMNEAAIRAAKLKRSFILQEDVEAAFIKVGIGAEKRSRVISDKEKRITAYHEAGHAILFHVLPDMDSVHTISIIPTGMGAAGYTMPLPGKDTMFNTKGKMLQHIIVGMGGRAAEELILGDVTTGASQDIEQATAMARAMVMDYGMSSKLGKVKYEDDSCSQTTAAIIDDEVHSIIDTCYAKAIEILKEHEPVLHRVAEELIRKEKIGNEEFEAIFQSI